MVTKRVELFHNSGKKYTITDIPIVDNSKRFFINCQLQKLIDEIEHQSEPISYYSLKEYLIKKVGINSFNSTYHTTSYLS